MQGECENCAKAKTCRKTVGIMFGYCSTEFQPKESQNSEADTKKEKEDEENDRT